MLKKPRRVPTGPVRYWWVLATTCISVLLVYINTSSLTLALPEMSRDLGATSSQASWFLLSYMLTTTALILVFGRITDVIGRRPLYVCGVLVFLTGSLWCGVSSDPDLMIVARLFQGVGGAAIVTNVSALLTDVFPRAKLATALGINVSTVGAGQVLGPLIGGVVVDSAGWRWLFLGTVPLAIVGLVSSLMVIPRTTGMTSGERFDGWGALTSIVAISGAVLAVSTAGTHGWSAPTAWGGALAFVISGIAFVVIQRRSTQPLVHPSVFADRRAVVAFTNALLGSTASYAIVLLASLVLQVAHGMSPSDASWAILPAPAGTVVASAVAGALLRRFTARTLSAIGLGLISGGAIGFALLLLLPEPSYPLLAVALGAGGVGVGVYMTPNTSLLMVNLSSERRGIGNAVRAVMHNGGYLMSTTLALAIATSGLPREQRAAAYQGTILGLGRDAANTFVAGARIAAVVFAVLAAIGIVVVLAGVRKNQYEPAPPPIPVAAADPNTGGLDPRVQTQHTTTNKEKKKLTEPFDAAGYGAGKVGFGRKAAALVVDFQLGFTDGEGPMARSPYVAAAVARCAEVLTRARALGLPVLHTVVEYSGPQDLGHWKIANLAEFTPGSHFSKVDPRVHADSDAVITKRYPSAFFGTDAASILRYWDVDTVLVMGCITSGCVRASVIDCFSNGFRTIVADDCCGDHDPEAHASNMRDIDRRYADVMQSEDMLTALARMPAHARTSE